MSYIQIYRTTICLKKQIYFCNRYRKFIFENNFKEIFIKKNIET